MQKPITKTVWDIDDVLLDSEQLAMQIMDNWGRDFVQKYAGFDACWPANAKTPSGVALPGDTLLETGHIYNCYKGVQTSQIVQDLMDKFALGDLHDMIRSDYNLPNDGNNDLSKPLAEIVTQETINAFEKNLEAIPHITETLQEIDRMMGGKQHRAACTTSPEDRMEVSLKYAVNALTGQNANLDDLFSDENGQRIAFSGYHVKNKYTEHFFVNVHPEWDPAECVIIEDSLSGATKAKELGNGIRVIGTVAASSYEDKDDQAEKLKQVGADFVISDIRDIPLAIEWMNKDMTSDDTPNFHGKTWSKTYDIAPDLQPASPTTPDLD